MDSFRCQLRFFVQCLARARRADRPLHIRNVFVTSDKGFSQEPIFKDVFHDLWDVVWINVVEIQPLFFEEPSVRGDLGQKCLPRCCFWTELVRAIEMPESLDQKLDGIPKLEPAAKLSKNVC